MVLETGYLYKIIFVFIKWSINVECLPLLSFDTFSVIHLYINILITTRAILGVFKSDISLLVCNIFNANVLNGTYLLAYAGDSEIFIKSHF